MKDIEGAGYDHIVYLWSDNTTCSLDNTAHHMLKYVYMTAQHNDKIV